MNRKIIYICILYCIAYIYSLSFAPKISTIAKELEGKDSESLCPRCNLVVGINQLHESSIIDCKYCICKHITSMRGHNYYISVMDEDKMDNLSNSLITFWGMTHFILYFFIGMVAPEFFWETFTIGVGFELYEYYEYKCHDPFDIVLNSMGFICGKHIAEKMNISF